MYGHGPQSPYHAPPPAPRPPPPGLSPVAVALLVVGGIVVVVGGVIFLVVVLAVAGAQASTGPAGAIDAGAVTATGASSTRSDQPAAEPSTQAAEPASEDSDDVAPVAAEGTGKSGAAKTKPSGGSWSCTASASVRVCGFAGACNYQMVFGNGFGPDRFAAQRQAKSSCETSARIKGASAVCVAQCSQR